VRLEAREVRVLRERRKTAFIHAPAEHDEWTYTRFNHDGTAAGNTSTGWNPVDQLGRLKPSHFE